MATLREYYDSDFVRNGFASTTWQALNSKGDVTEIIVRVYEDFTSNAKYISYFIPELDTINNSLFDLMGMSLDALKGSENVIAETWFPGEERM